MLTEGAAPERKSEVRTRGFYYKVIQATVSCRSGLSSGDFSSHSRESLLASPFLGVYLFPQGYLTSSFLVLF